MRDSLSAFDQVRAFAGDTIVVDDVVTVLGLVGRDLVFDMLDAVAAEDAPAAFALVERAIERGYDLRLLCRELARATRDLLILSVDPKRASDPDVAADAERERLAAHGRPVVARRPAARVRSADQGGAGSARLGSAALQPRDGAAAADASCASWCRSATCLLAGERALGTGFHAFQAFQRRSEVAAFRSAVPSVAASAAVQAPAWNREPRAERHRWHRWNLWHPWHRWHRRRRRRRFERSFLSRGQSARSRPSTIWSWRRPFASTSTPAGITFAFLPNQKNAEEQCDEQKAWLKSIAEKVAGKPVPVSIVGRRCGRAGPPPAPASPASPAATARRTASTDDVEGAKRWPIPPCRPCSRSSRSTRPRSRR